jgi:hypothetical protein
MPSVYRVDSRYRPQLLFAMMKLFASNETRILFEGNLSNTALFEMDGTSHTSAFEKCDSNRLEHEASEVRSPATRLTFWFQAGPLPSATLTTTRNVSFQLFCCSAA